MADTLLRELEREWKATGDPTTGLHLILTMFRAGLAVDLDSFPLELWHRIAADFSIEKIAHHLSLGGERLDRQFSFWQQFLTGLPRLGIGYPNLTNNIFSQDNLLIIARAAIRQTCKSSLVYYPTLPEDKRVAMYITIVLSPQTLSELDIQQMREGSHQEDTTHWGLAMKAFFDPAGSPRPQQLAMVALIDVSPFEADPDNWVAKVLKNVPETYDMPVDPPRDNLGYRVPFLVLKELR